MISDEPFDQKTVDGFRDENCRHCVSVTTETSIEGGFMTSTLIEVDERLGLGKSPGIVASTKLNESSAIIKVIEEMVSSRRYQPEWWWQDPNHHHLLHTENRN